MAAVLESVTVPRSSVIRAASHAPIMASSSSSSSSSSSTRSLTSSFKIGALSEFKGLKIQPPRRTFASVGLKNSSVNRRGIVCETQKTTLEVPGVTDATWQSLVVESTLPVLVEFWAPWCGPCRMIHPVIGELSKDYAGKLSCYNLNTDESPGVATKYGIRSIPTVMIFKGGEKKDAIIGAVPKATLSSSIEKFL